MPDIEEEKSRANDRIRDLIATNKELKEKYDSIAKTNSELLKFVEEQKAEKAEAEKIKKEKEETDSIAIKKAEEEKLNSKLSLAEIANKKADELILDKAKNMAINSGILLMEDLNDLKTVEEVNAAIILARRFNEKLESKVEEEANKKAKIILDQEKANVKGKKSESEKELERFRENLKNLEWI